MSFLGNLLWIVFGGGLIIFFEYIIAGVILCLTIVGLPFGWQCIKLSILGLLPFGQTITENDTAHGCLTTIMNVLWLLLGGIWITLTHLLFAALCAVTIIGIPFARQHIKLASLALSPFGYSLK